MFRKILFLHLVVFVLSSASNFSFANGCYMPEMAYPKLPDIPLQRAIVVWKGGIETLVVESALDSESKNVGWILPLPAEPTSLAKSDAGTLTSMTRCVRPKITHDIGSDLMIVPFIFLALIPLTCVWIFRVDDKVRSKEIRILVLLYIPVGLVLTAILLPSLGRKAGGSTGSPFIQIQSIQRVGNYDVSVLRAENAGALAKWLADNKFKTLDERARTIVDDYISHKWCFMVARLRRDSGGPATPHPILATFPADKPVYPMKLTALADSTTRVELYVIADKRAAAEQFRVADCHKYSRKTGGRHFSYASYAPIPYYTTAGKELTIGNPDVCEMMWNGCVVTRLETDLEPQQMKDDISIGFEDYSVHRDHFFTAGFRNGVVSNITLAGLSILLLCCAVVFHKRRKPPRWEVIVLIVLMLATLTAAGITYFALPTIPAYITGGKGGGRSFMYIQRVQASIDIAVADGLLHDGMSNAGLAKFPDILEKAELISERYLRNPVTGERMKCERSPGNFSIRTIDSKRYICLYGPNAREIRIELSPPSKQSPPDATAIPDTNPN